MHGTCNYHRISGIIHVFKNQERKHDQSCRRVKALHTYPVLAAALRPLLAGRRRHRRADAVGAGGAGSDGLCGHRRPAAASGSLHAAGRAARLRAARHVAPSGGAGHLGHGRAARFVGGGGAGGYGRGERFRSGKPTRPTRRPSSWSPAWSFWWRAWRGWASSRSSCPSR